MRIDDTRRRPRFAHSNTDTDATAGGAADHTSGNRGFSLRCAAGCVILLSAWASLRTCNLLCTGCLVCIRFVVLPRIHFSFLCLLFALVLFDYTGPLEQVQISFLAHFDGHLPEAPPVSFAAWIGYALPMALLFGALAFGYFAALVPSNLPVSVDALRAEYNNAGSHLTR